MQYKAIDCKIIHRQEQKNQNQKYSWEKNNNKMIHILNNTDTLLHPRLPGHQLANPRHIGVSDI